MYLQTSNFSTADQGPHVECLGSVISMATIVLSLSSGANNMFIKKKDVIPFDNLLRCTPLIVTPGVLECSFGNFWCIRLKHHQPWRTGG